MDCNKSLTNLRQGSDGCGATADVGAGASRGVDGACQKQLGGLFVDVFGGAAGFFGKLEGAVPWAGESRLRRGRSWHRCARWRRRIGAQEHAEGGDDHGFTCAGFTGQHGESGFEGEPRIGDDAEVSNMDFLNHERFIPFL